MGLALAGDGNICDVLQRWTASTVPVKNIDLGELLLVAAGVPPKARANRRFQIKFHGNGISLYELKPVNSYEVEHIGLRVQ